MLLYTYLDESKPMQLTFCHMQKKTVINPIVIM